MVREPLLLVVGPENFLGHQVVHAAALENLGQGRRIAEAVWQPQQLAVYVKHFFVIPFPVEQLADQGLAPCHVGVRLHPHGPVRDPPARFDGFPDPLEQLGVVGSAHLIGGGLALDEFIVRILLQ